MPCSSKRSPGKDHGSHSQKALEITSFVRRLNGSCQSSLITASDGRKYVLKFNENPQGPNVLANEAFVTRLATYLELPVPRCATIHVSDQFIREHRAMWFELEERRRRPRGGMHFGSQVPDGPIYELLSGSQLIQVSNVVDFLSMLVFDLWTQQCDNRQAVFVGNCDTQKLRAVFIDHGHALAGPKWDQNPRIGICLYSDLRIYRNIPRSSRNLTIMDNIAEMDLTRLRSLVGGIPKSWSERSLADKMNELVSRKRILKDIVSVELESIGKRLEQYEARKGRFQVEPREQIRVNQLHPGPRARRGILLGRC